MPRARRSTDASSLLAHLPVALGAGLAFALVSAFVLAPHHLEGSPPVAAIDFAEYCGAVASWASPEGMPGLGRRSRVAALPAALLAGPLGVVDGLLAAALLCTVGLGAAMYAWGAALGGRLAGLLSVTAALAASPLVLTPRLLNFYPLFATCFTAAAAGVTAALVRPSPGRIALGAVLVGACLVVDVRGVVWAAPMLLGLVVAALHCPDRRPCVLSLAATTLALSVSWVTARWAWPAGTALTLEQQADVASIMAVRGSQSHHFDPVVLGAQPEGFLWGHSSPLEWPATARFLLEQGLSAPPAEVLAAHHLESHAFDVQAAPWLWVGGVGLAATVLLLARRPRALLAVLLTVAPFLAGVVGMRATHEVTLRFLAHLLPPVPVLVGVALAGGLAVAQRRWGLSPAHQRLAGAGMVAALLALLLGVPPSPAGPDAAWREGWKVPHHHLNRVQVLVEQESGPRLAWDHHCVAALQAESGVRDRFESRLYGALTRQ